MYYNSTVKNEEYFLYFEKCVSFFKYVLYETQGDSQKEIQLFLFIRGNVPK